MELAGLAVTPQGIAEVQTATRSPSPSPVSTWAAQSRGSSMSSASFMPSHFQTLVSRPGMPAMHGMQQPPRASSEPPQSVRGTIRSFSYPTEPQGYSTPTSHTRLLSPITWVSQPRAFQSRTPSPSAYLKSVSSHWPCYTASLPASLPVPSSPTSTLIPTRRPDSPSVTRWVWSAPLSCLATSLPCPTSSSYRVVQQPTRLEPVALPQALPLRRSRSRPVCTTLLQRIVVPRTPRLIAWSECTFQDQVCKACRSKEFLLPQDSSCPCCAARCKCCSKGWLCFSASVCSELVWAAWKQLCGGCRGRCCRC